MYKIMIITARFTIDEVEPRCLSMYRLNGDSGELFMLLSKPMYGHGSSTQTCLVLPHGSTCGLGVLFREVKIDYKAIKL